MSSLYLWNSQGSSALTIQALTSSGSCNGWNSEVNCDASVNSAVLVVTLPPAINVSKGQSVTIIKTDNSTYPIKIVANGLDKLLGIPGNNIYLFNQNDAITLCNQNGDSKSLNDNRTTIYMQASFMRGSRTTAQTTGIAVNSPVIFSSIDNSLGSDISLNTITGVITFKANKTYELTGGAGEVRFSASGYARFQWYNITTSSFIGTGCGGDSAPTTSLTTEFASAILSPSVDTQIALYPVSMSNATAYGYNSSFPSFTAKVISQPASVLNTVDYLQVNRTGTDLSIPASTTGTDLVFNSKIAGNILYDTTTGIISLFAGKTYKFDVRPSFCLVSTNSYVGYAIVDASTNALISQYSDSYVGTNIDETLQFIYTPTTNQTVKVRACYASNTTGMFMRGSLSANPISTMIVTQIGSTAIGWDAIINRLYPVGHIEITENSANPATYLGFGTWVQYGQGQVLVGIDTTQTEFNTVGKTGGSKTHTNTIAEMVQHTHDMTLPTYASSTNVSGHKGYSSDDYNSGSGTNTTSSTGSGQAYSIMNPYITVYMWKRTA